MWLLPAQLHFGSWEIAEQILFFVGFNDFFGKVYTKMQKTYKNKRKYVTIIYHIWIDAGGRGMLAIERKNAILERLQKEQRVLVAELSQEYGVTEETIRRDLDKLEREGFVKKTYGGAVLNENTNIEMPLRNREKMNRTEKQTIAKLVAALIEDGEKIILDSSSTSLMVAQELKDRKNLTVITNSLEVLIEFSKSKGVQVISTGGILQGSSLSLVGRNAEKTLENFYVDKAIISCRGLDIRKGVTDSEEADAEVKRSMVSSSKKLILAADNTKFGEVSFAKVLDIKKVDILVTDSLPDDTWKQRLDELGVIVVTEDSSVSYEKKNYQPK